MHGRRGCLVLVGLVALATKGEADDLEQRLRSPDPVIRHEALDAVARLPAARAVPLLVGALDSSDPFLRLRAVHCIGRFDAQAAPAVPALADALYDASTATRAEACAALARCGYALPVTVLRSLAETSQALSALGRHVDLHRTPQPPALPTRPDPQRVAEALRSADPREREEGAWMAGMLAAHGGAGLAQVRPELEAALVDEDPFVAGRAAAAFARGLPTAPGLLRSVAALTSRPSRFARRKACEVLALLPGGDVELARRMEGDDPELAALALSACAQGPNTSRIRTAALRFLVRPTSQECRERALNLIGSAREPLPEALGPLIALLDDPAPGVAPLAAQALQRYGAQAAPALETLSRLAPLDARFVAALAALGPPAEPRLLELLDETEGHLRAAVLSGLGALAGDSPRARAAVEAAAQGPDPALRRVAEGLLERFAARDPIAFEALLAELRAQDAPEEATDLALRLARNASAEEIERLLTDPDWRLHAPALTAVLRREPPGTLTDARRDELLAALRSWPEDDPAPIRDRRDWWIRTLDRPAAGDLPRLERQLRSDDAAARREALGKLAILGPAAAGLTALLAERAAVADEVEAGLAFRVLGAVGAPAIELLAGMLGSENPVTRRQAAGELTRLPVEQVLPALAARCASPDLKLRRVTAGLLGKLAASGSPGNSEVGEELARWCDDPDADVRAQAIAGLGRAAVSNPRPDWVALLCSAATNGDDPVAQQACMALGTLAEHSDEALSALGAVLTAPGDPEASLRTLAAYGLSRWPERSRGIVDRALGAGEVEVRLAAVTAITPKAGDAAQRLRAVFADRAPAVRAAVLERAVPAGAYDLLLKGIDDPRDSVRSAAVRACRRLGPHAGEVLPGLLDRWIPMECPAEIARVFGSLGLPALEAAFERAVAADAEAYAPLFRAQGSNGLAYLLHRLSAQEIRVRGAAIRLLGAMGPAARDARPALEALAHDPELAGEVRTALARIAG